MLFKNLKSLEGLEQRLVDAVAREKALATTKTELMDAVVEAKSAGRPSTSIEKKLNDCRGDLELADREVTLIKQAIIDHHEAELDKEFSDLPADRQAHVETAKRLTAEGKELLERTAAIYTALGLEHADTLRRIVGKAPVTPPELTAFRAEASRLSALAANSVGQYKLALVARRVARSGNRTGLKIMSTNFLKLPGEASGDISHAA